VSPGKLLALALAAAIPSAPDASVTCDDRRAVEVVRAQTEHHDGVPLADLEVVVEGPYGRAKFTRTHPSFRTSAALRRSLGTRTFYFVWFHPPLRGSGTRGSDVWALVGASRCDLLHVAR
jgi:hypothetical protein